MDELLVYLSPSLIGEGNALAGLGVLGNLAGMRRYAFAEVHPLLPDLRLFLRAPGMEGPVPGSGETESP